MSLIIRVPDSTFTEYVDATGDAVYNFSKKSLANVGINPALPAMQCIRSDSAKYTGSSGYLVSAGPNIPRWEHDPITLEPLGILIESSSNNYALYSQDFSNAVWDKTESSVAASAVLSPDGVTTMQKINTTTANAKHGSSQGTTVVSGEHGTVSSYFMSGECNTAAIELSGVYPAAAITYNFSTGVPVVTGAAVNHRVDVLKDGRVRLSITGVAGSNGTATYSLLAGVDGATTFAGALTDGIYAWGAQHERARATATSYITTTGVFVNRAADLVANTLTPITQSTTSVFVKYIPTKDAVHLQSRFLASLEGNLSTTRNLRITFLPGSNNPSLSYRNGGALTIVELPATIPGKNKTMFSEAAGINTIGQNGAVTVAAIPYLPIGMDRFRIGHEYVAGVFPNINGFNGVICEVQLFLQPISSAVVGNKTST